MAIHENVTSGSAVENKDNFLPLPFVSRFFLVLVSLTIVVSSVIVLAVLGHTRSCLNKMQLFLQSLAAADLLTGLMWFILHLEAIVGYDLYQFSNWLCLMVVHLPAVALTVSVLTLSLISTERYIAIVKPFQYHKLITRRRTKCAVVSVWLMSAVLFVPIYFALLFATGDQPDRNCENNFKKVLYTCFFILTIVIIPNVFLSLYCYMCIVKKVMRRDIFLSNHQSAMRSGRRHHERTLAKISISIFSGFYVMWLPFVMVSFVAYIELVDIGDVVYNTTLNIGLWNSLLNCLTYSISHKPFRTELKLLVATAVHRCCCLKETRQPSIEMEA